MLGVLLLVGWNWKAALGTYTTTEVGDLLLTQECLNSGECVEENTRGNSLGGRLLLKGVSIPLFTGLDYLAHRFVHPKAPLFLRVGVVGHRAWVHLEFRMRW